MIEQLNNTLLILISNSYQYMRARNTFLLLYSIGCRASEIVDLQLSEITSDTCLLYQKKTKTNRLIYLIDVDETIRNEFLAMNKLFFLNSYTQIQYYFNLFSQVLYLRNNTSISTHIFRHYKAKQKFSETNNYAVVSSYLGESDPASSLYYISSNISIISKS